MMSHFGTLVQCEKKLTVYLMNWLFRMILHKKYLMNTMLRKKLSKRNKNGTCEYYELGHLLNALMAIT